MVLDLIRVSSFSRLVAEKSFLCSSESLPIKIIMLFSLDGLSIVHLRHTYVRFHGALTVMYSDGRSSLGLKECQNDVLLLMVVRLFGSAVACFS